MSEFEVIGFHLVILSWSICLPSEYDFKNAEDEKDAGGTLGIHVYVMTWLRFVI